MRNVNLDGLPLARMVGGPTTDDTIKAYQEASLGAAVRLDKATLRGTNLEGARLSYAHMEEVSLVKAHLDYADLSCTHLERAWLDGATLMYAIIQMAHAEGASICGVYASHVNAEYAFLEGVFAETVNLTGANFREAHLEYATFNKAKCQHANFSRAHLSGTSFQDAHLEGTDMSQACLRGRQLSNTELDRVRKWYRGKLWYEMPMDEREKASKEIFPDHLPAANLTGAFFDTSARLNETDFGDAQNDSPKVVDVHWNDVNLSVVDWNTVKRLGDEQQARTMLKDQQQEKMETTIDVAIEAALRANRQFSLVLQTQGLNEIGSRFAYRAHLVRRLTIQRQLLRQLENNANNVKRPLISLLLILIFLTILHILPTLPVIRAMNNFALAIVPLFIIPLILQLQLNRSLHMLKLRWQEHILLAMLLLIFLPMAIVQIAFFPLQVVIIMLILIFLIVMIIVPMRLLIIVPPAIVFIIYFQFGRTILSLLPQGLVFLTIEYFLFVIVIALQGIDLQPSTTPKWFSITWFMRPLRAFFTTWLIRPLRTFLIAIYLNILHILFSVLILYGQLLFSLFLDALAGYGYRPGRSLIAHIPQFD